MRSEINDQTHVQSLLVVHDIDLEDIKSNRTQTEGLNLIMQRELVERRCWLSEERFLHALNYCLRQPGPEAKQLAIYIGWLMHRVPGGLVAGVFFVIPSVFAI